MTDTAEPKVRKPRKPKEVGPQLKQKRDEDGLLPSIDYKFRDDGSIDWKAMIPKEYIVANDEKLGQEGVKIPEDLTELDDPYKLILLGGIKEIAKIRGLIRRENEVNLSTEERAVITTTVTFIPNYESSGRDLVYSETASATFENTGSLGKFYLETIASNRAFVRAVRNALRIDIVGSDECNLSFLGRNLSEEENLSDGNEVYDILAKKAAAKGYENFKAFKDKLIEAGGTKTISLEMVNSWESWKDLDSNSAWALIIMIDKAKGK